VQARRDDAAVLEAVAPLDHAPSRTALEAERGLMARLGGGCALPLGAFAEPVTAGVRMVAIVLTADGGRAASAEVVAPSPAEAAEQALRELLAGGADEILSSVRP
jgi:hydroxymethylbilane synthase